LNTLFEGKPPKSGRLSVDCGDSTFVKAKKTAQREIDDFEAKNKI